MINRPQLILKIGFISLLIGIFAVYGWQRSQEYLKGPQITIEYPQNKEVIQNSYLEVGGTATNVSILYLNGRQIFTDNTGKFKESLLLAKGYNIIEVSGKDKFDRQVKDQREIILK